MKKSIKLILFLYLSSFAFIGCNEKEEITGDIDGKSLSKNFVQVYIVNNDFKLTPYANHYIHIQFLGNEVIQNNKNDEKLYHQISKQYNDLSFNKKLIPFQNIVLSNKLKKINVTCDKAFDDKHPVGSSLNDVVMLCASSCWGYIQNGYKPSKHTIPQEMNNLIMRNGVEGYMPIFSHSLKTQITLKNIFYAVGKSNGK